jgi:hypothetical protein
LGRVGAKLKRKYASLLFYAGVATNMRVRVVKVMYNVGVVREKKRIKEKRK